MSTDFKTVLVESSTIADVTSSEIFGVMSGPSLSTYTQFAAISSSSSQITFNVQVPSESILINRELLIGSTITFTISGGGPTNPVPNDEFFLNWGLTESLQCFPLQSLFSTIQATINNVSTSTNLQDVLPLLLRMNDPRKLSKYNSTTPTFCDQHWGEYAAAVSANPLYNSNNNALSSYNNCSYDSSFHPRGAFKVALNVERYVNGIYVDSSLKCVAAAGVNSWKVGVTCTVVEPFIALSPFTHTSPMSSAGLLGINNMSIVCNIDNSCKRLMSTANTHLVANELKARYITNVSLGFQPYNGQNVLPFQDTRLFFNFQTLQPEQYSRIRSKNVVPYSDYPRFLSTYSQNTPVAAYQTTTLTSQNIQLNQVPGLIMIAVRVPMSEQSIANTSSFLQIENISINFNSQSGLLASAKPCDLFNISQRNGSSQSYYEWFGAVDNNNLTGSVTNVSTTGSILVLNPALDFSMQSFLSNGSLGQFSFQFNITVKNQFSYQVKPEIILVCKNDGLFITESGSSVIFTALLDKATVLRTKSEEPSLDYNSHQRLVGGRLSDMAMSGLHKMLKNRQNRQHFEHAGAMSGGAMSGGGSSGGAMSGGSKLSRHLHPR